MAFRVPTLDVSVVDLTVNLNVSWLQGCNCGRERSGCQWGCEGGLQVLCLSCTWQSGASWLQSQLAAPPCYQQSILPCHILLSAEARQVRRHHGGAQGCVRGPPQGHPGVSRGLFVLAGGGP